MTLGRGARGSFPWLGSLAAHAAVFVVAASLKHVVSSDRAPDRGNVEVEFIAPPAPPPRPSVQSPLPEPSPQQAVQTRPREAPAAMAAHRALTNTAIEPQQVEPSSQEPSNTNPEPSGGTILPATPNPTIGAANPNPSAPNALTAASLFNTNDSMAAAAASAGGVDLGRPGSGYRASRDLFGRPRTGSRMDQIREAAAGPALAALAESNHMQAAGTGEHDARVSRRAEEEFNPVREIANLGEAIRHAPMVGPGAVQHVPTAGEAAAGDALDSAHGQSFAMATGLATVPGPASHTLRADVEVDQDATGAIVAARVARSSGHAAFDRAALNAIRAAIPDAPPLHDNGRRSRWAFEVSESAGALGTVLNVGGGNEGWRMISETSDGVHLRMRVRRIASRPLQGS
jgi:TonB family protein